MKFNNYKGYNLRNRVFGGFLVICILSLLVSMVLSFVVLKNNFVEQSNTEKQKKTQALIASLDYVISNKNTQTQDLPIVLKNKIYEIADINKQDIVVYDLDGNFLISNKDLNLISQKKLPKNLLKNILADKGRIDIESFDENKNTNSTSSYFLLKNFDLKPIGIVYFPYYYNNDDYINLFSRYIKYLLAVNLVIIGISILISWLISNNLTKALTNFSEKITNVDLFQKNIKPIRYFKNDELSLLVKAYNKMILEIQDQKERLSFKERDEAWREMAKQVAHEVKNPLTPMKLTIQNFERKFNPNDPNAKAKVKELSDSMINQIELISSVANSFSQFTQLPVKNNELLVLNKEIKNILNVFSDENIFFHESEENITTSMDKIYLSRIITNLVTNAKHATSEVEKPIINVDLEKINKRIIISVEDNGVGISSDKIDKIFEPNFTTKSGGMGLGLTMIKKMVEDYLGEVKVISREGKGAKFIISLPENLS